MRKGSRGWKKRERKEETATQIERRENQERREMKKKNAQKSIAARVNVREAFRRRVLQKSAHIFNVIIMWCSWKVFVCRHDSGDGFIAYTFLFHHFPSHKVHFQMLHKTLWIGRKQTCTHMNLSTPKFKRAKCSRSNSNHWQQPMQKIRATIVRIFTSYIQSRFVDRHRPKKSTHTTTTTTTLIAFLIAPVVTDECRKIYDYLIITANLQVIVLSSGPEEITT